jgi:hypothetical protein
MSEKLTFPQRVERMKESAAQMREMLEALGEIAGDLAEEAEHMEATQKRFETRKRAKEER